MIPYAPCIVYLPTFGIIWAICGVNDGKYSSTMEHFWGSSSPFFFWNIRQVSGPRCWSCAPARSLSPPEVWWRIHRMAPCWPSVASVKGFGRALLGSWWVGKILWKISPLKYSKIIGKHRYVYHLNLWLDDFLEYDFPYIGKNQKMTGFWLSMYWE